MLNVEYPNVIVLSYGLSVLTRHYVDILFEKRGTKSFCHGSNLTFFRNKNGDRGKLSYELLYFSHPTRHPTACIFVAGNVFNKSWRYTCRVCVLRQDDIVHGGACYADESTGEIV